jgi:hypothetical protein
LAPTKWDGNPTPAEAVAATIRETPDAIVLKVNNVRGLAPGGLGA